MAAVVLLVLLALSISTVVYFKWCFGYWRRKKIPYRPPVFPLGNVDLPLGKIPNMPHMVQKHYNYLKAQGVDHGGFYAANVPIYIPFGVKYLKQILVKDFDSFVNRGMYFNEELDPLSANIFFREGKRWKEFRSKLTPAFTSGKSKIMFNILLQCSYQLRDAMIEASAKNESIDIKDMDARFTTDVIGSYAFGIDCNSCRNPDAEFRKYGRMIMDFSLYEIIRNTFSMGFPNLSRRLGVILVKPCVSEFFMKAIHTTVTYRQVNNIYRKDFLQMLIDLRNNHINNNTSWKKMEEPMTMDEMAAEAFGIYVAGFETSSSTLTFILYELAQNMDIQERAREEVLEVLERYDDKFCYEAICEMPYIQKILDETLRKHPIVPILVRKANKDYTFPDTDITLDKGTRVFIPVQALHHDPDNFPEPEKFDPERFSPENKKNIKPFTYLPFGEGPRACLGLRFGMMQSKLGLATVLKHFRFTLNKRTKVPVVYKSNNFLLEPVGEVYLDLERIR